MSSKIKNNEGFTLVEVLMALVVLGTSLMGVLMLFSKGTMFISQVQSNDLVLDLLEERMELIRQSNFNDIISSTPPTFTPTEFNQLINPQGNIVVDFPPGTFVPSNRMVRVTVTISWDSPSGQSLSRSMVTYITQDGISS